MIKKKDDYNALSCKKKEKPEIIQKDKNGCLLFMVILIIIGIVIYSTYTKRVNEQLDEDISNMLDQREEDARIEREKEASYQERNDINTSSFEDEEGYFDLKQEGDNIIVTYKDEYTGIRHMEDISQMSKIYKKLEDFNKNISSTTSRDRGVILLNPANEDLMLYHFLNGYNKYNYRFD